MRTLGIDYGTARVGLALSDEMGVIATPHSVLSYSRAVAAEIAAIVARENVGAVVVGMPYDLRGRETESTRRVKNFVVTLGDALTAAGVSCPIHERDEALSSQRAVARMVEAGVRKEKRRQKENTDMWAAAIILQEHLDEIASHR